MSFTRLAIKAYIDATILAYQNELITTEEIAQRAAFLFGTESSFVESNELQHHQNSNEGEGCGVARQSSPLMEFKLKNPVHLSHWLFTIGDPDPHPSIPHGHWQSPNSKRKLDPYTGWEYFGPNRTNARLSRAEVATFWNDIQFRKDALKAIYHALNDPRTGLAAQRKIQSRGVTNPSRLPRRRKR